MKKGLIIVSIMALLLNAIAGFNSAFADWDAILAGVQVYYDFDRSEAYKEAGYFFGVSDHDIYGQATQSDNGFTFSGNGYVSIKEDNQGLENSFSMGFTLSNIDSQSGSNRLIFKKGRHAYPVILYLTNEKLKLGIRSGDSVQYFVSNTELNGQNEYDVKILYADGHLQLFVNGELDVEAYVEGELDVKHDGVMVIGGDDSGSYDLTGSVDQFYFSRDIIEELDISALEIDWQNEVVADDTTEVIGAPRLVDGVINQAIEFPGDGSYLVLGEDDYNLSEAFTVAFWLKLNDDDISSRRTIYQRGTYVYPLSIYSENGTVEAIVRTDQTNYIASTQQVDDGQWHSMVMTFNNGTFDVYVDGELDVTQDITGELKFSTKHNLSTIGADNQGNNQLYGCIDDFKLLNIAVSSEDIPNILDPMSGFFDTSEEEQNGEVVEIEEITYYIDYDSGDDANEGTAPNLPWKHCPGDLNATGQPANHQIKAGNQFVFKGGVEYHGSIEVRESGTTGAAIQYLGNAWGAEKATLIGSDKIEVPLVKCMTEEDAEGSALYENLYYFQMNQSMDPLSLVTENGSMLYFSMKESYDDLFWYKDYDKMVKVAEGNENYVISKTTFRNDIDFITEDEGYYDNTLMLVRTADNRISIARVEGFDPMTNTLTYGELAQKPTYDSDGFYYYGLMNHIDYLDQPGEQYFDPDTNRLYIYPMTDNPQSAEYRLSTRENAIKVYDSKHINIEGFKIREYAGLENETGAGAAIYTNSSDNNHYHTYRDNDIQTMRSLIGAGSIAISDCDNLLIEGNQIENIQSGSGIVVSGNDIIIDNNKLINIGRSGISMRGVSNTSVTNNYISSILDMHGNAMSVYRQVREISHDVLVANNTILMARRPFTCHGQYSKEEDEDNPDVFNNYVLYNNLFQSEENSAAISWGRRMNGMYVFDNIFISYGDKGYGLQTSSKDYNVTAVGNILSGMTYNTGGDGQPYDIHHNIYVKLAHYQDEKYGWSLAEDEVIMDPNDVFVDYAGKDLTLKDGVERPDGNININDYITVNEQGYMVLKN